MAARKRSAGGSSTHNLGPVLSVTSMEGTRIEVILPMQLRKLVCGYGDTSERCECVNGWRWSWMVPTGGKERTGYVACQTAIGSESAQCCVWGRDVITGKGSNNAHGVKKRGTCGPRGSGRDGCGRASPGPEGGTGLARPRPDGPHCT